MTRPLADAPNWEQIRKQAKDLLKARRAKSPDALGRIKASHPQLAKLPEEAILAAAFVLADAQLVVAREYGFASWPRLRRHVESLTLAGQLKDAISANDVARVRQLVRANRALLRAPIGYGGDGPLTWAAECRVPYAPPSAERLEIARLLIEEGADVHEGGDGPLMRAALRDDRIPMMELLVRHGADVNARWHGRYPIIFAPCETLAPGALQWLIDHGADPNIRGGSQGEDGTPLDMAVGTYDRAGARQRECVDILISAGGASKYADLPSMSIHRGRLDLLAEALDADAGLVARRFPEFDYGASGGRDLTLRGGTLLHVAAEYGDVEAMRLLLERGADVNARALVDENGVGGQTPLFHVVTQFRDHAVEAARLLIARGADVAVRARVPSAYDRPGETVDVTPLGYAARFPSGHWEVRGAVDLLRESGAPAGDVYAAAKLGMTGELRALLAAGGDPDAAHPYGESALAAALAGGHAEAEELLRQAGASE